MTITEISELVSLISVGVGLIVAIIGWVKTAIKNIKEKKLFELVEQLMAEAEKAGGDGKEKKAYVIKKVIEFYGNNAEVFVEKVSDYIEQCIDFSKKVNNKK